MDGSKLLAILVTGSLLGSLGLFVYSLSLEPVTKEIREIGPEDVGSHISVSGIVAKVWTNSRGDLNLILTDGEAYIRVYIPEEKSCKEEALLPGAFVSAEGEVQLYAGELEIFVTSTGSIRILKESTSDLVPLKILAEMPEVFAGEEVRVQGLVQNIQVIRSDRMLNLSDEGLWVEAEVQKDVSFEGSVDIYGSLIRTNSEWKVLVSGEGDILAHPSETPKGYEETSLGILLGSPTEWEGKRIALKNMHARFQTLGTVFDLSAEGYEVPCMIFGWDWTANPVGVGEGSNTVFEAVWEYYSRKATWQLVSDYPSFGT
ncbi:MAG: hypothetical protein ACXADO_10220 [Candidatus Thorarchaeota archaeon]